MKLSHIILTALLVVGMSSCSTIRKTTATVAEVQTAVVQYPTVTDLTVLQKTERTIVWQWNPFRSDKMEQKRSNLIFDLLKELDADILLEAHFHYSKEPFGERRLTISGYPAKFKDFRKATQADLDALKSLYTTGDSCCKKPGATIYNISKRPEVHKRFLGIF